jgi:hypothetical protein
MARPGADGVGSAGRKRRIFMQFSTYKELDLSDHRARKPQYPPNKVSGLSSSSTLRDFEKRSDGLEGGGWL